MVWLGWVGLGLVGLGWLVGLVWFCLVGLKVCFVWFCEESTKKIEKFNAEVSRKSDFKSDIRIHWEIMIIDV